MAVFGALQALRAPQGELMTTQSGEFTLEAKYTQERGRIYLSGIQALVRLPLDHHRADLRRGLNTATFISGYRGSPLGGFDQTLERLSVLLEGPRRGLLVRASTRTSAPPRCSAARWRGSSPGPATTACVGMWYGKAPGVDRTGDLFKHANYAGVGKNGGVLALAGDDPALEVLHAAEPLRGRALRRVHAHALPGQRAGDPRPGPARLHALAHLGPVGRAARSSPTWRTRPAPRRSTRSG